MTASTNTKLKAILIDLSGTLHIDDEPTKNAVSALDRYVSIGNRESLMFIIFFTQTLSAAGYYNTLCDKYNERVSINIIESPASNRFQMDHRK